MKNLHGKRFLNAVILLINKLEIYSTAEKAIILISNS